MPDNKPTSNNNNNSNTNFQFFSHVQPSFNGGSDQYHAKVDYRTNNTSTSCQGSTDGNKNHSGGCTFTYRFK